LYDCVPRERIVFSPPSVSETDTDRLRLKEGTLSIEGRIPQVGQTGQVLLTEYRLGSYFRNFRVTDAVDADKISASMSNEVLKVTLPKIEKAVPKEIPITSG
jgi:HSP20 family protein